MWVIGPAARVGGVGRWGRRRASPGPGLRVRSGSCVSSSDLAPLMCRRFLAIVATPEVFGSCDGAWSSGSGAADGEAGAVRTVDRPRGVQPGGVPDRRGEPADR